MTSEVKSYSSDLNQYIQMPMNEDGSKTISYTKMKKMGKRKVAAFLKHHIDVSPPRDSSKSVGQAPKYRASVYFPDESSNSIGGASHSEPYNSLAQQKITITEMDIGSNRTSNQNNASKKSQKKRFSIQSFLYQTAKKICCLAPLIFLISSIAISLAKHQALFSYQTLSGILMIAAVVSCSTMCFYKCISNCRTSTPNRKFKSKLLVSDSPPRSNSSLNLSPNDFQANPNKIHQAFNFHVKDAMVAQSIMNCRDNPRSKSMIHPKKVDDETLFSFDDSEN